MYDILLVDDEYFYREALKNTISWESCGCRICGEANNGLAGIEKARALKPDIVLADVNMPFMDGLQMIRAIRDELPDTLFAIVTGYSEFEYARRGMELGVRHYIIKPVDNAELVKNITRMVEELDRRKQREDEYASLRFWADRNASDNRRVFLEMLLEGSDSITPERFAYECSSLGLPIQNGGYAVCCLRVEVGSPVSLTSQEWEDRVRPMLMGDGDAPAHVLLCNNRGLHILFYGLAPGDWDPIRMGALMQRLQVRCMQDMVCTVVAGVGSYCPDYTGIPVSCARAEGSMVMLATSDLVRQMLQYIHENYADPDLTLQRIADALYANYSYLSAQFAREVGMSANQYLTRFRMTKAASDLRAGKDNMIRIACDVGYTDVKYFYRSFKKVFELTPYQYLEALRRAREGGAGPATTSENQNMDPTDKK